MTHPTGPLAVLLPSWVLALRAEDKSERTVASYSESVQQLDRHLAVLGVSDVDGVRQEHVQGWLVALAETRAPKTVWDRFVGVRLFFRWAAEEDEIRTDPTARQLKIEPVAAIWRPPEPIATRPAAWSRDERAPRDDRASARGAAW